MESKRSYCAETATAPFPTAISSLLKERKITPGELAGHLGVTRQTVSNYCLGQTTPSFQLLCEIADFFNVSTDYLLGRTETRSPDANIRAVCEFTGLSEQSMSTMHCIGKQDGNNRQYNDYINHPKLACELVDEFIDFTFNSGPKNNKTITPFFFFFYFRKVTKKHNENAKKWNDMKSSDERVQFGAELMRERKSHLKAHVLTNSAASDYYRRSFCDDFNDYLKEKYPLEDFLTNGGESVTYGID